MILRAYDPSVYSTEKKLERRCFLKGLQNYMENKCEGNENKITLEDFNFNMDKMDSYGGNKT